MDPRSQAFHEGDNGHPLHKLLRTTLTALGVLTALRLLRSPIAAIVVPRYVSGWGLHKAIAFALPGLGLGWWLLAYAEAGED